MGVMLDLKELNVIKLVLMEDGELIAIKSVLRTVKIMVVQLILVNVWLVVKGNGAQNVVVGVLITAKEMPVK